MAAARIENGCFELFKLKLLRISMLINLFSLKIEGSLSWLMTNSTFKVFEQNNTKIHVCVVGDFRQGRTTSTCTHSYIYVYKQSQRELE